MDGLKQKVETLNQICVDKFGCTVHQLMDDYHFHGLMELLSDVKQTLTDEGLNKHQKIVDRITNQLNKGE